MNALTAIRAETDALDRDADYLASVTARLRAHTRSDISRAADAYRRSEHWPRLNVRATEEELADYSSAGHAVLIERLTRALAGAQNAVRLGRWNASGARCQALRIALEAEERGWEMAKFMEE